MLNLAGRSALIVGGGPVAARRAAGLVDAGARVTVVAPEISAELAELAERGTIRLYSRAWLRDDLDGVTLVVTATGVAETDGEVAAAARRSGVLCNVASEPRLGDLAVPAVLRRGDLLLAVGTSGKAPGLAGALRRRLERSFGPEWAAFVPLLASVRTHLPRAGEAEQWDRLLDDPALAAALQRGDNDEAREQLERILTSRQARP